MFRFKSLILVSSVFCIMFISSSALSQGNWEDSAANPESWTTGNVGIGTASPSNLLDVQGGVSTFGDGLNNAQIDANGNLIFLGTSRFHVSPNTYAFSSPAGDIGLFFNAADDRLEFRNAAGLRMFSADIAGTNPGSGYFDSDLTVNQDLFVTGNMVVEPNTYAFRAANSDIGLYFNQVDARIEAHDGVGTRMFSAGIGGAEIGNGYFRNDLEVGGTATATFFIGDGSLLTNLPAGSNLWQENSSHIYYQDKDVAIGTDDGLARLTVNTAEPGPDILRLQVDGSTEVVVDPEGKMGIGVVTPAARLSISEPGDNDAMRIWTGNQVQVRVDGDGNTGFGTDLDPLTLRLSVRDDNHQIGIIDEDNGDKLWSLTSVQDLDGFGIFEDATDGHLVVETGGQVGIGQLRPQYQLHVTGGGNATTQADEVVNVSELNTVFQREAESNGEAVGIGFSHSTDAQNIGAAILHEQIGGESLGNLHFATKFTNVSGDDIPINMTLDYKGDLGLGTTSPNASVHIEEQEYARVQMTSTDPGVDVEFFVGARGDGADGGEIGTDSPHGIVFMTEGQDRMWLSPTGSLGIGTQAPQSMLAVAGKVTAQEVEVTMIGWPDYVFDEDYELMPLDEVESHITTHKHLPGVPSEADVVENGLPLGEMQKVMMEKIEELTLHLIEMNKQNRELQDRISSLESQN